MAEQEKMKIIARVHTDFPTKFGVPRQSRLVEGLKGRIVFEPEFRNPDALEGLEGYSHIWVIWEFSENVRSEWSATVRPPRLGRNRHMLKIVNEAAEKNGAAKIGSIRVRIGAYSGVVPELIEECFGPASRGTAAEGAKLFFEAVPVSVECRDCGRTEVLREHDRRTDYQLLDGQLGAGQRMGHRHRL